MPTLTSSSSSPRCAPFPCRRGTTRMRGLPPAAHGGHHHGCGRPLGRAARVVGGGIAAAFFASLERCACVEVRTKEEEDDDVEVAPLMLRDAAAGSSSGGSPTVAKTTTGGRRAAANGKQGKRRGLGCCENDAIN